LSIIIQNLGRSEATKYKFVISFSNPDIRIVDVAAESLVVDGVYVHDSKFFQNTSLLNKLLKKELQIIYEDIGLNRDYVTFVGSLESFGFESLFLRLKIPDDCEDFVIIFRIDCSDFFFYNKKIFAQFIKVVKI